LQNNVIGSRGAAERAEKPEQRLPKKDLRSFVLLSRSFLRGSAAPREALGFAVTSLRRN